MDEQICYPKVKNIGLRGITVADTQVSLVDGQNGKLIYRGYSIEDLAEYCNFEEIIHLLINGKLPTEKELTKVSTLLKSETAVDDQVIESLRCHPSAAHPMDVLQGAIPFLADYGAGPDGSKERLREIAYSLTAKIPTVVAAWRRIRDGLEPVAPNPELAFAANFLYMLNGEEPSEDHAKIFDVCLTLHADHTFNASTFAAREVASTRAHIHAAVSAAVGALSGELHGGANTQVMEMLKDIGSVENVEPFVMAKMDAGDRIMGMGHAVYKTMDPRAVILKKFATTLGSKPGEPDWVAMSEKVQEVTQREFKSRKDAEIYPNVDFFSAATYHMLDIPSDFFTPVFAIGRAPGWCAHVIEEAFGEAQGKPALYRPKAEYIGDYCGPQGCTIVPRGERD